MTVSSTLTLPSTEVPNAMQLRGWAIAVACLLAQIFGNGMVAVYGVFLLPISAEFGVGMSQMSLGMVIYILLTCLISPIIGSALKPGRIKPTMLCGALAMAVSMLVLSIASSVLVLAIGMVMLSISFSMYGVIPSTVVLTQWYDLKRGRALAVMAMGISIAGFTLPPLSAWLLQSIGWRAALLSLGLSGALILFVSFYFWVEEKPQGIGRGIGESDGASHEAGNGESLIISQVDASSQKLTKSRSFWFVGLSFGVVNTSLIVSGIYFIPYLQTLGLSPVESASLLAVGGVTGLAGKVVIGLLADYLRSKVIWLLLLLQVSLVFCWYALSQVQEYSPFVFVLLAIMGAAQGGTIPLQPYINSQLFGVEMVGKVTGLHGLFLLPFVLPAVPLIGYVVDNTSSYGAMFYGCSVLLLVASVFTLGIRSQKA